MKKQKDFGEYVLDVVGERRARSMFTMDADEWMATLTPTMVRKIKAYPHGIVAERMYEVAYAGGFVPRRTVTCACGQKFTARTLTAVYALHDEHAHGAVVTRIDSAGMTLPTAARTVNTAELLSA